MGQVGFTADSSLALANRVALRVREVYNVKFQNCFSMRAAGKIYVHSTNPRIASPFTHTYISCFGICDHISPQPILEGVFPLRLLV